MKAEGTPGEDGETPFIGENGNWWIGETDTEVKAEGTPGEDGKTPEIGENGNWWIDGTDTGVKAEGAPGEDGKAPEIGENGNWWIGDTDTGVKAEGMDGKTPTIGENGNWWIDGEDTGVSAKGTPGEDGKTPEIGENGNWWIDGEDTGVKAEGTPGEDGKTPFIGENGNWWIGDEDTGVSASGGQGGGQGAPGEDGKTPFIGENGNWWIGDEDTGVKAEGSSGENGKTPVIGSNGNWWIGDTDTGVKAEGEKGEQGEAGEDGKTPVIGPNGNWWIGDTDTGVKAEGEKGEQGEQGQQGVGIEKVEFDKEGNLLITFTDGRTQTVPMPQQSGHTHAFGSWKLHQTSVTNCEGALFYRVCADCFSIEWKEGTHDDHDWSVVTTPATCLQGGYDTKTCRACGKEEIDNVIGLGDHDWDVVTTPATCVQLGYDTKTCRLCSKVEIDHGTVFGDHDWNVVTTPATCLQGGYDTKTCRLCSKIEVENPTSLGDHDWKTVTTPATCLQGGYDTKTCQVCKKEERCNETPIADHEYGTSYVTDGAYHWFQCVNCTATKDKAAHTPDASWSCTACGTAVTATQGVLYSLSSDGTYAEVTGYEGSATTVKIASEYNGVPVKSIRSSAFQYKNIVSVEIPDSVTSIGSYAFYSCTALSDVMLGKGVTSIGTSAFTYCDNLATVKIPVSVQISNFPSVTNLTIIPSATSTKIPDNYCKANTTLKHVVIADGITSIGAYAFQNSEFIESVSIPEGVTEINKAAFDWCYALQSLHIPASVTTLGEYAINKCTALTSITFAANSKLTTIGNYAIRSNSLLTELTIPASVTSIGFEGLAGNGFTKLTFASGSKLTTLGEKVVYNCTKLTSVNIPANVTTIGTSCFEGASSLATVTFASGSKLTTIGVQAFYRCSSLTAITIPASVVTIEHDAIESCSSLATVTFAAGSKLQYIGDYAFYSTPQLTSIVIPSGVTFIGEGVFANCAKLTSITMEGANSYYYVGGNCIVEKSTGTMIAGCSGSVIPSDVTSIATYALAGSAGLTELTLPAGLMSIGDNAFKDCKAIAKVHFAGTQAQWNAITFGSGNSYVQNCSNITFACTQHNMVNGVCTVCGEKEKAFAVESGSKTSVSLSGYYLVYTSGSKAFDETMAVLATKIYGYTGSVVYSYASNSTTRQICVKTGSDAAINGHGFAIKYESGKITIIGTTALITQIGVNYFINTYLTGATISIPALVVSDEYDMVNLSGYRPVYSQTLDDSTQSSDASANNPDAYYGVTSETGRDLAVDMAYDLADLLGTSVRKDSYTAIAKEILIGRTNRAQSEAALALLEGHEYGIMMIDGRLVIAAYSEAGLHKARALLSAYLADATVNGQILLPSNLRIIGTASERWLTDVTLPDLPLYNTADDGDGAFQYFYRGDGVNKAAFDAYVAALKAEGYTVLQESNAEGSYFVTLTNSAKNQMIHVSYEAYAHATDNTAGSEWTAVWGSSPAIRVVTAYVQENYTPMFSNVKKPSSSAANKEYKTYESGVRQVYYLYNSWPTALSSYRSTLTSNGYTLIFYDNASERFVALNKNTGEWIEAYCTDCNITTGGSTYYYAILMRYYAPGVIILPDSQILNANQSYTKVTDSKIVSIDLSSADDAASYGTGYVIMLEDGRFVIIDGGASEGGTSTWKQVSSFWSIISSLYEEAYGYEPTTSNPVRIAAWIITHAHGDHMNMFWDFTRRYGGVASDSLGAYVDIDYVITNNVDYTMQYNTGEPNMTFTQELSKFIRYLKYDFDYIKAQTGQKYYFANLEIDTLFTTSNLNPNRIVTFNDTSSVQRLNFVRTADGTGTRTVNHKTASASSKSSFLSTGDMYRWGGRWLAAMFGSYLKTDMVSVSHHGGPGATAEFYDVVAPRVVWWSMNKSNVHGGYSTGSSWYAKVDQHLLYNVDSVEYVFVADDYHITLVLKADGPDYDGIYHATDTYKSALSYYTVSRTSLKNNSSTKTSLSSAAPVAIRKY